MTEHKCYLEEVIVWIIMVILYVIIFVITSRSRIRVRGINL